MSSLPCASPRHGRWKCTQCDETLRDSLEIREHLGLEKGTLPEKLCEFETEPEDIVFECKTHGVEVA